MPIIATHKAGPVTAHLWEDYDAATPVEPMAAQHAAREAATRAQETGNDQLGHAAARMALIGRCPVGTLAAISVAIVREVQ